MAPSNPQQGLGDSGIGDQYDIGSIQIGQR
jgi:hypothetical protein